MCKHVVNETDRNLIHTDELFRFYEGECSECNSDLFGRRPIERDDQNYNMGIICDKCGDNMNHSTNSIAGGTRAGRRHKLKTGAFLLMNQYFCANCHHEVNGMRQQINNDGSTQMNSHIQWSEIPAYPSKPN